MLFFVFLLTHFRCFAHIVNLMSKAMHDSAAIRGDHDYSAVKRLRDAIVHVSPPSFFFLISKPILCKIHSSSQRRNNFSKVLEDVGMAPLQLIRDVETRWSSVYLMITRAIALRTVCFKVIQYFPRLNMT
jgi:hypothetical protein